MPTPTEDAPTAQPPPLSTAEVAYLIRAVWDALRAPKWDAGSRKDLQKLGEALYSGKSLKQLDDDLYDRLLPHLKVVATALGESLRKGPQPEATSSPESPAEGQDDRG